LSKTLGSDTNNNGEIVTHKISSVIVYALIIGETLHYHFKNKSEITDFDKRENHTVYQLEVWFDENEFGERHIENIYISNVFVDKKKFFLDLNDDGYQVRLSFGMHDLGADPRNPNNITFSPLSPSQSFLKELSNVDVQLMFNLLFSFKVSIRDVLGLKASQDSSILHLFFKEIEQSLSNINEEINRRK
jgi:hypothetical protein